MIELYNAVGLIPTFWGIRRREEIKHNIEHLKGLTKAAFWLSNLDIPVRLLAIPEGALMGFNDEVLDVDHAEYFIIESHQRAFRNGEQADRDIKIGKPECR